MTFKTLTKNYRNKAIRDYGGTNSPEMKKFGRDFKSALNDFCKKNDFELISFNGGHYNVSGFIKNPDGKFIYIAFSVPRGGVPIDVDSSSYIDGVLYREAENETDYKGKTNHFTSIAQLSEKLLAF